MDQPRTRPDKDLTAPSGKAPEIWSNWSGSVRARPSAIARPQDVEALSRLIRTGSGPLRIMGAGHSFTPLVETQATLIDLSAFSGLHDHDAAALTARFGAATRISALTRALDEAGQALPNMGDVDVQTFAGAIATGTHGSGHTLGAYHTHLLGLELVDARGRCHQLTRDGDNADLLKAAAVSLGSFGAMTAMTVQNVKPYRLHRRRAFVPLDAVLEGFEALMRESRSVEFFVIPHAANVLLSRADIVDLPAEIRPPDDDEMALTLLRMMRGLFSRVPAIRRAMIAAALRLVPEEDFVEDWLKAYPNERRTRFNEMEYHLPLEAGPAVLRQLIPLTERHFPRVYFPMEVRVVAADDAWLSPFYGRETCSIAIHHDASEKCHGYFRAAEEIFLRHDGRPHWGKMHNLTARELAPLYPRFADALAVRRDFDPENRLVTPYMARLFGLDA